MEKPASVDEIIKLVSEIKWLDWLSICYKMLLGVMNSILLKVKLRMMMLFIGFLGLLGKVK